MIQLKNILVATDFSEPSEVALEYGRNLARAYGATIHVLHVVEDVTLRYATEGAVALPDILKDLENAAWRDVNAAVTADDRRTLPLKTAVETHVTVAEGITGYAKENQIDLIVVGTHGRGVFKHFIMGSVAERVVRTAPCPVLTVRSPERDFIAPEPLAVMAKV